MHRHLGAGRIPKKVRLVRRVSAAILILTKALRSFTNWRLQTNDTRPRTAIAGAGRCCASSLCSHYRTAKEDCAEHEQDNSIHIVDVVKTMHISHCPLKAQMRFPCRTGCNVRREARIAARPFIMGSLETRYRSNLIYEKGQKQ